MPIQLAQCWFHGLALSSALSNSSRKLSWFEISKMVIAAKNNFRFPCFTIKPRLWQQLKKRLMKIMRCRLDVSQYESTPQSPQIHFQFTPASKGRSKSTEETAVAHQLISVFRYRCRTIAISVRGQTLCRIIWRFGKAALNLASNT